MTHKHDIGISLHYGIFLEHHKGDQVKSLDDLWEAVSKRQSVFAPSLEWFRSPRPAAFVMNYQGNTLRRILDAGLWIYKKPNYAGGGNAPWSRP